MTIIDGMDLMFLKNIPTALDGIITVAYKGNTIIQNKRNAVVTMSSGVAMTSPCMPRVCKNTMTSA